MIYERFEVIGMWIFVLIITFMVLGALTFVINKNLSDFPNSLAIVVVVFVVFLELILCSIHVTFKNNPEQYGYTRIEQEAEAYEE